MNFLEGIFDRLAQAPGRVVFQEIPEGRLVGVTGGEFLAAVQSARRFLRQAGLKPRDRCALLAPNGVRWAAADLALMAEGVTVVPLYARQAARELVKMMQDSSPALLLCGDATLRDAILHAWPEAPPTPLFEEIFAARIGNGSAEATPPRRLADDHPLTIIYTSGTSGEPKGVVLTLANVDFMLGRTNAQLDLLMGPRDVPDRVFHYLPTCFAGSWILLLTCLTRNAVLTFAADLTKLGDEIRLAAPDYFLNVPALLERIRAGAEEQIAKRGGLTETLFARGQSAWLRRQEGNGNLADAVWLAVARAAVFRPIRKKIGPNLRALICGSAPLAKETQLFFLMLGLPVLQVYGLTETTAICTLDDPQRVVPGRVGPAIAGIEMKLGEQNEILVRGPNVFPGYWNRPEETAKVLRNGWLCTGDQGDVDAHGNWAITGRVKNLIILSSGHNIAPEPLEERLLRALPKAKQVMIVGHGRSFLAAIITGEVTRNDVEGVLEAMNPQLPHYQRIHAFHISSEPFAVENGMLTANGKLKRDLIAERLRPEIERLYARAPEEAQAASGGRPEKGR